MKNIKIYYYFTGILFFMFIIIHSCKKPVFWCEDSVNKKLLIVDSSGNNLLQMENSKFNKDSIMILLPAGYQTYCKYIEETGFVNFIFGDRATRYIVRYYLGMYDTLDFELTKNTDECEAGVTVSSKTFLNGVEISNSDTIRIVK